MPLPTRGRGLKPRPHPRAARRASRAPRAGIGNIYDHCACQQGNGRPPRPAAQIETNRRNHGLQPPTAFGDRPQRRNAAAFRRGGQRQNRRAGGAHRQPCAIRRFRGKHAGGDLYQRRRGGDEAPGPPAPCRSCGGRFAGSNRPGERPIGAGRPFFRVHLHPARLLHRCAPPPFRRLRTGSRLPRGG